MHVRELSGSRSETCPHSSASCVDVLSMFAQGLLTTWVANQSTPCHRQFGYAMAADALANFDASMLDTTPFGAPDAL